MKTSIITKTDSYKNTQPPQYPSNMVSMFDYAEARSGKVYPNTVFFGLQFPIKEWLMKPITLADINKAEERAKAHGTTFERNDWEYILAIHAGYLPVRIRAVPEGSVIPTGHPLFTVESLDVNVPWVVGFLETLLMKTWYTSNVATRSYYVRKMLEEYWERSVNDDTQFGINFAFHNFGDRGSSSVESAGIGGVAHLTQFLGTDNFDCLEYAEEFYNDSMAGFSISASEHSTTTSWGKENEAEMIMNHLEYNKGKDVMAAVLDSYDYLNMVNVVTSGEFKEKIESDEYPKFVMRPDSGNPLAMIQLTLDIVELNEVETYVNEKGFKVMKKYGIIWGDGIDMSNMREMLDYMLERGYSAENIAFGSGGWLMQQHDRDTQGWAVKCSSITVDDGNPVEDGNGGFDWEPFHVERDVFKDPVTAPNKKSKKGKVTTFYNPNTKEYFVDKVDAEFENGSYDFMETVYETTDHVKTYTLAEVRANSRKD